MRIYEFLFTKFHRVWFMGGLGGEVSNIVGRPSLGLGYFAQPYLIIMLSVNSHMSFVFLRSLLPLLPFLPFER